MEEIIFKKPLSPEEIAIKKRTDKLEDHFTSQATKMEFILNAALSDKGDILL